MFAPIVPAPESCQQDNLLNIIQDDDVDVQPLLDSVIPHKTVKGITKYTTAHCFCAYSPLMCITGEDQFASDRRGADFLRVGCFGAIPRS